MPKFSQDYLLKVFEHQIKQNHRTIYVVIGENSKYQIPVLHEKLSKLSSLNNLIWFYKNAETFMDREAKKIKIEEEDNDFFKWIKTQDPEYISYKEHSKVLGRTCDMLILQDFEALTPNMIACSMETVRGGGAIVLLLDSAKSMNEIMNKTSDLVQEASLEGKSTPRFNRRIFKALAQMESAVFLDSKLRIMDVTKEMNFEIKNESNKYSIENDYPLFSMCKTRDQLEILQKLTQTVENKDFSITSIVASRGRGKSVALGLAIAHALNGNTSNILISALFLENVQEIFTFTINGLIKLGFKKSSEFKVSYSFEGKKRLISKIEIIKGNQRTVEYSHPNEMKYQPDLLVIDEAASIPLPNLKPLFSCKLIFMATTACGYEGTGRVFRTKLKNFILEKNCKQRELQMLEPIRYSQSDSVELWLSKTLLLEPKVESIQNCPLPGECSLFYVNKDALFSGNSRTDEFLEEIFSLFVSSHYRNSPNDMQILSDSQNHEVFVLLTPKNKVICAVQVAYEGGFSKNTSNKEGNLIPWVVYDNYNSENFILSFGARIVRIAVHPSFLSMGYGSMALNCLINNFMITNGNKDENIISSNVLLYPISKVKFPKIDWIGSSFGLTEKLLNFWKKLGFSPVCVKQTPSKTTGEYSTVVLKTFSPNSDVDSMKMLFLQRFLSLLSSSFRDLEPTLALSLIYSSDCKNTNKKVFFTEDEQERLLRFSKGVLDIRNVLDVFPDLSKFYFYQKDLNKISLIAQIAILIIGSQCKKVDEACTFLGIEYFKLIGILMNAAGILLENK